VPEVRRPEGSRLRARAVEMPDPPQNDRWGKVIRPQNAVLREKICGELGTIPEVDKVCSRSIEVGEKEV